MKHYALLRNRPTSLHWEREMPLTTESRENQQVAQHGKVRNPRSCIFGSRTFSVKAFVRLQYFLLLVTDL